MGWLDAAGLVGVALVLGAYGGAQFDVLPPRRAPALTMNLVGSGLILASMQRHFNLAAFTMEAAWAGLALVGLLRLARRRHR